MRLGAFTKTDRFKLMKFDDEKKRESINYNSFDNGYFVPASLQDEQVLASSDCRIDGRFPTLSYINRKSGFAIWRSSELRVKAMGTE